MFDNVNGPDIYDFDPLPFVSSWLATGGRQSISYKPSRQQNWKDEKACQELGGVNAHIAVGPNNTHETNWLIDVHIVIKTIMEH